MEDRIRIADKNKEWHLQQLVFKYSSPLLSNLQPLQPISSIVYIVVSKVFGNNTKQKLFGQKKKTFWFDPKFCFRNEDIRFFFNESRKIKAYDLEKRWFDIFKFFTTSFCIGDNTFHYLHYIYVSLLFTILNICLLFSTFNIRSKYDMPPTISDISTERLSKLQRSLGQKKCWGVPLQVNSLVA